ncbi:MAG TPA: hypothetical protein VJT49_28925 [Amycolatopsis sp.]|uniref:hypothetical protein n=1 Tax=Amycolatopsis sp. TaxID=37632 RepID=UPI002B480704|nr:hypothetical protein [Amycolatopsis sp.]HKS49061.1 hypothetical protein [Amycolatopsis sp.]
MDPFLPAPQPRRWRRSVYAASLALPFATVQVWAVVMLLSTVTVSGPAVLALPLVIGGAVVAAFEGLHWAWRLGSFEPRPSLASRH